MCLEHHIVEQKNVIKVCQYVKETAKRKKMQQWLLDKMLLCVIKRFWSPDTVVTGNARITSEWQMPNELFQIKKQMLLQNLEALLKQFCIDKRKYEQKLPEQRSRKSFLLVLESVAWKYQEIEGILWEAQKRYEDIYIVPNKCTFVMENISGYFFEDCGVVLHVLEENMAKKMRFHTIFFLLEYYNDDEKEYHFEKQYEIAEWEENQFQSLLFAALNDTINDP